MESSKNYTRRSSMLAEHCPNEALLAVRFKEEIVQSCIEEMQSARNMACESKARSCAACGRTIMERFLLHAVDKYWHMDCLQCSCCSVRLGEVGTSCFSKGGMLLCRNDYLRLYGSSGACAACSELIPAAEMVMKIRDKAYHMRCFTCCECHQRLVTGDRIHFINDRIFCENDYPHALRNMATTPKQQQQPIFC